MQSSLLLLLIHTCLLMLLEEETKGQDSVSVSVLCGPSCHGGGDVTPLPIKAFHNRSTL